MLEYAFAKIVILFEKTKENTEKNDYYAKTEKEC